jgi:hypothetical protein
MVFENRVPKNLFGPARDEAALAWKEMHIEYLNDLYTSPNNIVMIN